MQACLNEWEGGIVNIYLSTDKTTVYEWNIYCIVYFSAFVSKSLGFCLQNRYYAKCD